MQVLEESRTRAQPSKNESAATVRRDLVLLLGACALLFFAGLWSWGFIDPGDGYFSEAAREMIERNDYVVPHLNYQIYFSKPILIFWLIAASYKVFGICEFAARFWSAASATLVVVVCYLATRSIYNRRAALLSGLALASAPLTVTFARMSLIDMGFSALLGIALYSTALTLLTSSRRWWPIIYISLGLAVLNKGPAAVVVYAAGMFFYLLLAKLNRRDIGEVVARLAIVPGLLIFLAITLPWYVAVGIATHGLWPQVFFYFENFGRFAGHTNHKAPFWWFYLPVVAYGFFPWAMILPAAWLAAVSTALKRFRSASLPPLNLSQRADLLFACFALGVILFFSLSLTKLQTYILPAWPAMAVSVAVVLDRFLSDTDKQGNRYAQTCNWLLAAFGVVALNIAFAAAALCCAPQLTHELPKHWAALVDNILSSVLPLQKLGVTATFAIFAAGCLAAWHLGRQKQFQAAIATLASTTVLAGSIGATVFYQLGYKYKNEDVHRVITSIQSSPGAVAIFREFKPSVVFHLQRPVDSFFSVDQLRARHTFANPPVDQFIIAGPKGAGELLCAFPTQLHVVSRSGDWYVFETHDLVAVRLPTLEQSFTQHIDLSGGEYSWGTLPFAGGTK